MARRTLSSLAGCRAKYGCSVVQPKRICVVDDVGSRVFKLINRRFAVAVDAAMVEGTVGL